MIRAAIASILDLSQGNRPKTTGHVGDPDWARNDKKE